MSVPPEDDELRQLIQTARKDRGLTQDTLAPLMGISQSYLSAIERGAVWDVGANILGKLHDALGVDLEELTRAAIARARRHGSTSNAVHANANKSISVAPPQRALDHFNAHPQDRQKGPPPNGLDEDEIPTKLGAA